MNRVLRAALLIFVVTCIPIGFVLYQAVPHPEYVQNAKRTLQADATTQLPLPPDTDQDRAAALILAAMPTVFSLSTAIVVAWCFVLLIGCIAAHQTMRVAKRRRRFTPHQVLVFNGIIIMTVVNVGVMLLGTSFLAGLMDTLILWNIGSLIMLGYLSVTVRHAHIFDCLFRRELLIKRAALIKTSSSPGVPLSALSSSETSAAP